MRTIITKQIGDTQLVGTVHSAGDARLATPERPTGILWLNSGFLPRSAVGDLYIHLAEHLAQLGYTVFRFDLPGLGDSEGDLPSDTQNLFAQLTRGAHGPAAAHLAIELCKDYQLGGIIFAGVCGGAVSSIFAACGDGRSVCCGVIQLDPTFKLVPFLDRKATKNGSAGRKPHNSHAVSLYSRWRVAFLQTRVGDQVHRGYLIIKPAINHVRRSLKKLRPSTLPENANRRLLACWIDLLEGHIPMLTIMAGNKEKRTEKFDYLAYIDRLSGSESHTVSWIHDTTHSFVEGSGIESTKSECEKWLTRHFPVERPTHSSEP